MHLKSTKLWRAFEPIGAGDHRLQHDRLTDFDVPLPLARSERLAVQLPPCDHRQLPALPRHRCGGTWPGAPALRSTIAQVGCAPLSL